MLEEIGLVFGVVSFVGGVMPLSRASNADAARVLSGAAFASLGAITANLSWNGSDSTKPIASARRLV
jgi:hypothetical protein